MCVAIATTASNFTRTSVLVAFNGWHHLHLQRYPVPFHFSLRKEGLALAHDHMLLGKEEGKKAGDEDTIANSSRPTDIVNLRLFCVLLGADILTGNMFLRAWCSSSNYVCTTLELPTQGASEQRNCGNRGRKSQGSKATLPVRFVRSGGLGWEVYCNCPLSTSFLQKPAKTCKNLRKFVIKHCFSSQKHCLSLFHGPVPSTRWQLNSWAEPAAPPMKRTVRIFRASLMPRIAAKTEATKLPSIAPLWNIIRSARIAAK